jgi:hypothetical protein
MRFTLLLLTAVLYMGIFPPSPATKPGAFIIGALMCIEAVAFALSQPKGKP